MQSTISVGRKIFAVTYILQLMSMNIVYGSADVFNKFECDSHSKSCSYSWV